MPTRELLFEIGWKNAAVVQGWQARSEHWRDSERRKKKADESVAIFPHRRSTDVSRSNDNLFQDKLEGAVIWEGSRRSEAASTRCLIDLEGDGGREGSHAVGPRDRRSTAEKKKKKRTIPAERGLTGIVPLSWIYLRNS